MKDKNLKKLRPFQLWALQNFPFIEADFDVLTNYEMMCKIVEYLNKVIDNSNLQNEKINELGQIVNDLESYIENYFDNLDVQEEINNKLDEMAESGQLADIISQYLDLACVLAYDTLNDLKEADNINNGSICKTLGKIVYNDGFGAYYKVRTITSGDVVDGDKIVSLDSSETLIAEKIFNFYLEILKNNYINVKMYGAKGDGITDDTLALQTIFNNATNRTTIYFPKGDYLISDVITVPTHDFESIILDRNAMIYTETDIETLFYLTNQTSYVTIDGGMFNGLNHANYCIKSSDDCKYSINYKNIFFRDPKIACIKVRTSTSSIPSEHGYIYNCKIYNPQTYATGFDIIAHDYTIQNCEIYYITTGIKAIGDTNILTTHIWAGGITNINPATGIYYDCNNILRLTDVYFDGLNNCVDTNGKNAYIICKGSEILLGENEGTYSSPVIIKNNSLGRTIFDDNIIKTDGVYTSILDLTNVNFENIQNWRHRLGINQIHYNNGDNYNYENISYGNNINIQENNSFCVFNNYNSISNGKYYKIGYLVTPANRVASLDLTFYLDDTSKYYQNVKVNLYNNNGVVSVLSKKSTYTYGLGNYAIAIGNVELLQDNLGTYYKACAIYVKVVSNQGNQYAMNVTTNIKDNNGILVLNQEQFNKEYSSPSLLDTLDSNI